MTTTFKHMRSEHAALLVNGQVRLSALSYLRRIEGAPGGVRDALEGQVVGTVEAAALTAESDPDTRRRFAEHGYQGNVAVFGSRVIRQFSDCYVYSTTLVSRRGLFGVDYDAVVQIGSIEDFGEALWAVAKDKLFTFGRHGMVEYTDLEYDFSTQDVIDPSPWKKARSFSYQVEHRCGFDPTGNLGDFIDVTIPHLAKLAGLQRIA